MARVDLAKELELQVQQTLAPRRKVEIGGKWIDAFYEYRSFQDLSRNAYVSRGNI